MDRLQAFLPILRPVASAERPVDALGKNLVRFFAESTRSVEDRHIAAVAERRDADWRRPEDGLKIGAVFASDREQ